MLSIFGDYGIEAYFSRKYQSEAPEYLSNKSIIESCPVNKGLRDEHIQPIDTSLWSETHRGFIQTFKRIIINGHLNLLHYLWQKLIEEGYIISDGDIPPKMAFWIIEKMYSDDGVKVVDKFTITRLRDVIIEALKHPENWNRL